MSAHRSFATLADTLAANGWAVLESFLPEHAVHALAEELLRAHNAGALRPAGVGTGARYRVRPDVRSDCILWLEPPGSSPAQRAAFRRFERLRLALNLALQLGLLDFECHFAFYPPDSGYRRHFDRPVGDPRRALSCVLYLNASWQADYGGALRLFLDEGAHRDVLPVGGTLVVFQSARFEHEVLPTRRARLSLAGWFYGRS